MSERSSTSYQEQPDEIFTFLVRNNVKAVRAILKKFPHCANSIYENKTLLDFPCRYGNKEMVQVLIQCGVEVNNCNINGSPPLVNAIIYNQFEIVKILCQNKAKIQGITLYDKLTIMDVAILHGKYDIALYLYSLIQDKTIQKVEFYQTLTRKYNIRYINYPMFIQGVRAGKSMKQVGDFLTKPKPQFQSEDQEQCCFCCVPLIKTAKLPKKENPKSSTNPETERKSLSKNG